MINLEHIAPEDWGAVERMRQALQSLVVDTGGQSVGIRFGTKTITFTASALSDLPTVTHGLGRTPAVVLVSIDDRNVNPSRFNVGATTFQVAGKCSLGAVTQTNVVDWVAVG